MKHILTGHNETKLKDEMFRQYNQIYGMHSINISSRMQFIMCYAYNN